MPNVKFFKTRKNVLLEFLLKFAEMLEFRFIFLPKIQSLSRFFPPRSQLRTKTPNLFPPQFPVKFDLCLTNDEIFVIIYKD